jgi:hypothetical protein
MHPESSVHGSTDTVFGINIRDSQIGIFVYLSDRQPPRIRSVSPWEKSCIASSWIHRQPALVVLSIKELLCWKVKFFNDGQFKLSIQVFDEIPRLH